MRPQPNAGARGRLPRQGQALLARWCGRRICALPPAEEEITEYDVYLRVRTDMQDEPLFENKRIEKMDLKEAKEAFDWSSVDTSFLVEAIGKSTGSIGQWVSEAVEQLQKDYAEIQFVFNRYLPPGEKCLPLEACKKFCEEVEVARATFSLERVVGVWTDLAKRRGSVGLPAFMEGLMVLAFSRSNPTYTFGTEARALAIVPLPQLSLIHI